MTLSIDLTDETLAEDVKYACVFWIEHICAIKEKVPSVVMEHLEAFLEHHLLHWIEAMSILGKSRNTIGLLDNLLAWMKASFLAFRLGIVCFNFILAVQLSQSRSSP